MFTLNDEALDFECDNLHEYGFLEHSESLNKMNDMDFLLLTIVPQNDRRDISAFTSPLKLYEYAATGKVILASDVPVLREVISDDSVFFCNNNALDFCHAIRELSVDGERRERMSKSLLDFAKRNTWNVRAQRLLLYMSSD